MQIVPRWSTLRTIGRSRLARATIFIPIVGYLFIFNQEITEYLKLIPKLGNANSPNEIADINLSRIICLYIGLSCIGIGSIIFSILCPPEIAANADEHEFNIKEMDVMTPFRFDLNRRRIADLKHLGSSPQVRSEIDRLAAVVLSDTIGASGTRLPELQGRGLAWTEWINRNRGDLSGVISVMYLLLDQSLKDARIIVAMFYCVGTVFLLLPSIQVFFRSISLLKTVGQYLFPW